MTLFEELNSDPQRPADIDFTHAHNLYREALAANGDLHSRFGTAITSLLVLTSDAEVNAAFDEWDAYLKDNTPFEVPSGTRKPFGIPIGLGMSGDDMRLPFDVVPMSLLAHGQIARLRADPQLSRIQSILRQRVIPKLTEANGLLGPVGSDPDYVFPVSPLMQGDEEEITRELDQTDVLALRAALSLLTAACRIAVAYEVNFATYDSTSLLQAFQRGSGWMTLTSDGVSQMRGAHSDMGSAVDHLEAAVIALRDETDLQDDDVIKRGPDVSNADIDKMLNEHLPDVREGLSANGHVRSEDWDLDRFTPDVPLKINLWNFFQDPVADWKELVPSYTVRIERGTFGSQFRFENGTTQVSVTAPSAGSYSAHYEAWFDADGLKTGDFRSGPGFLSDALVAVVDGEIANRLGMSCGFLWGSGNAFTNAVFENPGAHTVQVNWNLSYSAADACVYIPVIVWDADFFEEWNWPDPTFSGLFPDIGNQFELFEIFGITSADFRKEVRLDWGD